MIIRTKNLKYSPKYKIHKENTYHMHFIKKRMKYRCIHFMQLTIFQTHGGALAYVFGVVTPAQCFHFQGIFLVLAKSKEF